MNCARARPSSCDDRVERLDPVRRLVRVAVGQLALEVAELDQTCASAHLTCWLPERVSTRSAIVARSYPSAVASDRAVAALGIDVGGTGVKAALVDLDDRRAVSQPRPHQHAQAVHARGGRRDDPSRRRRGRGSTNPLSRTSRSGCGMPCVVKDGVVHDRREHRQGAGSAHRPTRSIGDALGRRVLVDQRRRRGGAWPRCASAPAAACRARCCC